MTGHNEREVPLGIVDVKETMHSVELMGRMGSYVKAVD